MSQVSMVNRLITALLAPSFACALVVTHDGTHREPCVQGARHELWLLLARRHDVRLERLGNRSGDVNVLCSCGCKVAPDCSQRGGGGGGQERCRVTCGHGEVVPKKKGASPGSWLVESATLSSAVSRRMDLPRDSTTMGESAAMSILRSEQYNNVRLVRFCCMSRTCSTRNRT